MKRSVSLIVAVIAAAPGAIFAVGAIASSKNAPSATGGLPVLTIAMNGTSVSVGGSLQSGAVNVVSTVTREAQGGPALVLLKPGASPVQAFAAVGAHHGDLNYLDPFASLVFNAFAPKGVSSAQTVLVPGTYVALDTGHSGGRPIFTEFTVTQAANPASLPKPRATVMAIEFGFRGPVTLHRGELVRFENGGFLVHMIDAIGVKDVKTARIVTALLLAGKDNSVQRFATSFPSFAGPLSQGGLQQLVITAKPGVYVLACFMNTQDGREHTQLGMERTIRILK